MILPRTLLAVLVVSSVSAGFAGTTEPSQRRNRPASAAALRLFQEASGVGVDAGAVPKLGASRPVSRRGGAPAPGPENSFEFVVAEAQAAQQGQGGQPAASTITVRITLINHLDNWAVLTIDDVSTEVGGGARRTWEQTASLPLRAGTRAHTPFPPEFSVVRLPNGTLHITFILYKWV